MALEFRILWIDDDRNNKATKHHLERQKENISKYLKDNYFVDYIETNPGTLNMKKKFPYDSESFDLFIIDFTIGSKKGFEYIEWIRSNSLYTDIIFYSSNSNIENEVMDYLNKKDKSGSYVNSFLQGVFISTRGDLSTKFEELLDIIERKVNNLSSMRGLVLAETADLEYILCEIIDKLCDKKVITKNGLCIGKYNSKTKIFDFNLGTPFDGTKKMSFTDWLSSKITNYEKVQWLTNATNPNDVSKDISSILVNINNYRLFYENERNNLAHQKTRITASGIKYAGGVKYDIADLKDMRKKLLEFRECFEKFRDK